MSEAPNSDSEVSKTALEAVAAPTDNNVDSDTEKSEPEDAENVEEFGKIEISDECCFPRVWQEGQNTNLQTQI